MRVETLVLVVITKRPQGTESRIQLPRLPGLKALPVHFETDPCRDSSIYDEPKHFANGNRKVKKSALTRNRKRIPRGLAVKTGKLIFVPKRVADQTVVLMKDKNIKTPGPETRQRDHLDVFAGHDDGLH